MKTIGILLVSVLSLHLQYIQAFQCTRSLSDVALTGHVMKSHQSLTIENCHSECRKNPFCKSINYYFQKRLCQHNSAKISEKPSHKIEDNEAVYVDNPEAMETDGWILIARFSNSDTKHWMATSGAWWYDVTTDQGDVDNTTVNQDMIAPAFWTVTGQEIKITRTDDSTHTALLTTTSNCLGGQTFRAKLTSYGNFRNGAVWASNRCLGSCNVTYGGNYAATAGFAKASCDGSIQTRNKIGFWCDFEAGDGAVMMIGGGGSGCDRADHGIGITEENAAKFRPSGTTCDFGNVPRSSTCSSIPYALNLWIK